MKYNKIQKLYKFKIKILKLKKNNLKFIKIQRT